jgi:uncharacterized oxidoreductase
MTTVPHEPLQRFVASIFARAGCDAEEAACVARHLVRANLVGHDSHGVIRVPPYLRWLRDEKVIANRKPAVVFESGPLAVVDGGSGFGQVSGEFATRLGVEIARKQGVGVVALRNAGHLGRVGDWPEMAAEAGMVSLHFVSTSGFGLLVAPLGGIDRRLSANPIAVGVPVEGARPIILDISTCSIAEGKIRVAFNRGQTVPEGCVIDAEGRPTNEPAVFYADPPGAILPFGGHKGYGLSVITEILAGALTGNGCGDPATSQVSNGMLSIVLDPDRVPRDIPFGDEVRRFIAFVKGSRPATPGGEVLMPGEVEDRTLERRLEEGIPLEDLTRDQLIEAARSVGVEDMSPLMR